MERRGKKPGKEVDCCCGCHALAVVMWYAREIIFNRKGLGDILWISREFGRCQRTKLRDKLLMGRCYTVQRWGKVAAIIAESRTRFYLQQLVLILAVAGMLSLCSELYICLEWVLWVTNPAVYNERAVRWTYLAHSCVVAIPNGWSQTRWPIEP